MKYPLLLPVVLSLGCSVLFDPAKAPPRACPGSAAACPALPNATASCEAEACQYSCGDGFVDATTGIYKFDFQTDFIDFCLNKFQFHFLLERREFFCGKVSFEFF